MLLQLRIENFAVIEEVELSLHRGLNILTGETGAGKSMIVGAANLLRGARVQSDKIRQGAAECVVEASFDVSRHRAVWEILKESGIPRCDDEILIIRRIVSRQGKNRIYVNNALSTANLVARLTEPLLDICGQHEFQRISDRGFQRDILDAFAGHGAELETMQALYQQLCELADKRRALDLSERDRLQQIDFLRFQLDEIDAGKFQENEQQQLDDEYRRLSRAQDLRQAAYDAEQFLYSGDQAASESISRHLSRLRPLADADAALKPLVAQLEEAHVILEDVAVELRRYADGIVADPERLADIEQRVDLIHRLRRKHGCSLAELLSKAAKMRQDLSQLESLSQDQEAMDQHIESIRSTASACAEKLSVDRKKAARIIGTKVSDELRSLCMPGAHMDIRIQAAEKRQNDRDELCFSTKGDVRRIGRTGWDQCDFLVATNGSGVPQAIGRIASGGELSRITLALRKVMGQFDPVSTVIFDEVDTGIGGAVADVVGRLLSEVAQDRQVIVVTHLPQVAAHADQHFFVGKGPMSRKGKLPAKSAKIATAVATMSAEERIEELARMLAGSQVTRQARAHAKQLIDAAS